jgi:hypothetical protein
MSSSEATLCNAELSSSSLSFENSNKTPGLGDIGDIFSLAGVGPIQIVGSHLLASLIIAVAQATDSATETLVAPPGGREVSLIPNENTSRPSIPACSRASHSARHRAEIITDVSPRTPRL